MNKVMIQQSDSINGNIPIEITGGEYDGNKSNNTIGTDAIIDSSRDVEMDLV